MFITQNVHAEDYVKRLYLKCPTHQFETLKTIFDFLFYKRNQPTNIALSDFYDWVIEDFHHKRIGNHACYHS